MLRITKESDYAFLLLTELVNKDLPQSASELAELTKIPAPVTSKILKKLVKQKILKSVRGVQGGYVLMDKADNISALAIIAAMEGVPGIVHCADGMSLCALSGCCKTSHFWQQLNAQIVDFLASHSLMEIQSSMNNKVMSMKS